MNTYSLSHLYLIHINTLYIGNRSNIQK